MFTQHKGVSVSLTNCSAHTHTHSELQQLFLSFVHRISFNKQTCVMRAEVNSAVGAYPRVMFSQSELWMPSSRSETCLAIRPRSVITLKPCQLTLTLARVCWESTRMDFAEYCLALQGQTHLSLQQPRFSDITSSGFFCVKVRGLSIGASALLDQSVFSIWYPYENMHTSHLESIPSALLVQLSVQLHHLVQTKVLSLFFSYCKSLDNKNTYSYLKS